MHKYKKELKNIQNIQEQERTRKDINAIQSRAAQHIKKQHQSISNTMKRTNINIYIYIYTHVHNTATKRANITEITTRTNRYTRTTRNTSNKEKHEHQQTNT